MSCSCGDNFVQELKLIWLAGTDAVSCPEYSSLLDKHYEQLKYISPCGRTCVTSALFPLVYSTDIFTLCLARLLSNPLLPDNILDNVVSRTPTENLQAAWALVESIQIEQHLTKELTNTFNESFPSLNAPFNKVKKAVDDLTKEIKRVQ